MNSLLHYITHLKPYASRLRRTRTATTITPMITATTCSPHTATITLSGAPVINAINGRSVGAGRGAGGVSREAEKLVGKTAAIACAVIVGDGLRWMIVAGMVGVAVASIVGVAAIVGVEVGSGVAVEVE